METQGNGLESTQNNMLAEIEAVKQELLQLPNVVAVGIGIKESNGAFTGEISYRVFVTEKKSEAALSKDQLVPRTINNIKTDVLTPYIVRSRPGVCGTERRTLAKHRPIKAGIAISTDSTSYGTLGWFGHLDIDDTPILLTNKHVLYGDSDGTDTRPLATAQPQLGHPSHCCCCECGSDNVIGEAIIGIRDMTTLTSTSVDCAIAKINTDIASEMQLLISNSATSEVMTVSGTAQAVVGQAVRKIGARSGFTRGTVVHIGDAAVEGTDPAGDTIEILTGQVLVIPDSSETYQVRDRSVDPPVCKFAFSNNGDSGSAILNDSNEIVALLYGGDETTNSVDITFANNIANVLNALSTNGFPISLSSSPSGGRNAYHHAAARVETVPENQFSFSNQLEHLRDTNRDSQLHHLFDEHHREILALINHARPVTVAWQRHQGPAFVAAIARAAREEHYRIPEEINGVSRTRLLLAMKEALILSGSAALQQDIVRYESAILKSVSHGDTIRALAEQLLAAGLIDHIPTHLSPAIA